MSTLPPCGLYRTGRPLGDSVPAGRLVSFHNHGNPGPGVYLPSGWTQNRATFHAKGIPIPDEAWVDSLEPLLPEGFYRVEQAFTCCEKHCRTFEAEQLVQLGYTAQGEPLLFAPEWRPEGFALPAKGTRVGREKLGRLVPLRVPGTSAGQANPLH
jgi:hypothetical protein